MEDLGLRAEYWTIGPNLAVAINRGCKSQSLPADFYFWTGGLKDRNLQSMDFERYLPIFGFGNGMSFELYLASIVNGSDL